MSAISGFCEKCNKFRKGHCDGNRNTCMSILFDTIEALQQENEQLQEFANAKADGRLKILPAKPGDIIYRPEALQFCWVITKVEIYEDEIVFIDDSDNIFRPDDIGKTVFLTHEEAEKVLEAKRRGGKKDDLQNYLKS